MSETEQFTEDQIASLMEEAEKRYDAYANLQVHMSRGFFVFRELCRIGVEQPFRRLRDDLRKEAVEGIKRRADSEFAGNRTVQGVSTRGAYLAQALKVAGVPEASLREYLDADEVNDAQ